MLEAEEGGGGLGWSEGISPLVQMDPLSALTRMVRLTYLL